jgi:hypothetical protein
MQLDEARRRIINGYAEAGHRVESNGQGGFIVYLRDAPFLVADDDIAEYASVAERIDTLAAHPVECSIANLCYREHLLTESGASGGLLTSRVGGLTGQLYTFGDINDGEQTYAEVGPCTPVFKNYFRFSPAYVALVENRVWVDTSERSDKEPPAIRDINPRLMTIRVHNITATTQAAATAQSSALFEGCLFQLAYLRSLSVELADEWPQPRSAVRRSRTRPFEFGDRIIGRSFPMPRTTFNPEVVRFYQRAFATDDPVIQFLSFYQVMEYFFVQVSDERLYEQLARRIRDPKFNLKPMHLDRVIQDVLDHRKITDETEMLKSVLTKFVDVQTLISFITAYETYLGEKMYTKKRVLFGEEIEVRPVEGHVIANVASTVKAIRNAVVHSSDRYERQQRYIPNRAAHKSLSREIPLMRFLAEQVVLGTASP